MVRVMVSASLGYVNLWRNASSMFCLPKKWFTWRFYQQRNARVLARERRAIIHALAKSLWQTYRLSSLEDWGRSFNREMNLVSNNTLYMKPLLKCCYTSLKHLFAHYHLGGNGLDDFNGARFHTEDDFSKMLLNRSNDLTLLPSKSVSFVRNPYARLVSCYRNKIVGLGMKDHSMLVPESCRNSFGDFVGFVCEQLNSERNLHVSSQWFALVPGLLSYDFIGYCEHFSEHAHLFFAELGASEDLLATISIKRNATGAYDWRDYYDENLADVVYQNYYPDFKAFGYHKDSWKRDFQAQKMPPMRQYDPMKDIEAFRAWFPCKVGETC